MELKDVRGIGEKTLINLNNESIYTIDDLVHTFPRVYTVYEVNNYKLFSGEYTCIQGIVKTNAAVVKFRRNCNAVIFYVTVDDKKIKCVTFSSDYLRYKLHSGVMVILYGRYKIDKQEFIVNNVFFDDFLVKVDVDYKIKNVTNALIQKAVNSILINGYEDVDYLPEDLINKYRLVGINDLIRKSHYPETKEDYIQIQRRRKYEEFFWYSVLLEYLKMNRVSSVKKGRVIDESLINSFIKSLPYELTIDQAKVIDSIMFDIKRAYPMNRLVQGDVGSGKSIVAYTSVLMAITAGFQGAIMVPTEILAQQQYENLKKLFAPLGLCVEILTSSTKKSDKKDILYRLASNRVHVIVGTHALLEDTVSFFRLGLIVIDEQHRFGVNQRSKLIAKYPGVDCLYLTATPIPRTLGLTAFGDLDISSIHTKPSNRKEIITRVYDYNSLDKICESLKNHIAINEQVYIVVPLVEENEDLDAMDITSAYEYFSSKLEGISVSKLHGKMKSDDKKSVMNDFKTGKCKVLISTTVIEVGVDVPQSSIMVILDANRFGLAQIHQLRGRVGRGSVQSYCILVSKVDNERLRVLEKTSDGFEIAEADLMQRGPGDYLGEEQSGFVGLTYADFQTDFKIWSCAREDGQYYCHYFLDTKSKNKKFNEIISTNKSQNSKIN